VVVTNPDTLRGLAKAAGGEGFIAEAPVCVVVLCRETEYYLENGCAATQNILLAAHACGLGSCWVAGAKKAYAVDICKMVGAPPDCKLISLVSVGYPEERPIKIKRPLSDVLHWEKYGSEGSSRSGRC
jgi:nitroreductase